MLLTLGSKAAIVISSPESAYQVLKSHDHIFGSRPHMGVLTRVLANGKDILVAPYGEYWRQMRSICMIQLLSKQRVRSFRNVRKQVVDRVMERIWGASVVNLSEFFVSLSGEMMCKVTFGGAEADGVVEFIEVLGELTKLVTGFYVGDYISWLGWIDYLRGVDGKVRRTKHSFDVFLENMRRKNVVIDGDGRQSTPTFANALVEAQRDGRSGSFFLDDESVKGLLIDMLMGGTDTMYIALEWTMSELLRNPRVMKELQKEVRTITGSKTAVSEDDLENMKYLKAVIKESLRLHPPVPLLAPHQSKEDVKINGYNIEAGTVVIVNAWAIGRDSAYWEEPECFYPERFLNSPIDFKGNDFQFIPFGSGRRSCPGMAFAISGIELVIAHLVHGFDWALPNGANGNSLDMREAIGLSILKKRAPLLVVPTPRICSNY